MERWIAVVVMALAGGIVALQPALNLGLGRATGTLPAAMLSFVLGAVGLGSFAPKLLDVQDNEISSWLPESAESTQAIERLGASHPESRHHHHPPIPEDAEPAAQPLHRAAPAKPGNCQRTARLSPPTPSFMSASI